MHAGNLVIALRDAIAAQERREVKWNGSSAYLQGLYETLAALENHEEVTIIWPDWRGV